MARPKKEGLEYFPIDVDMDQDDKLVVVIGKYGMLGFGIVVRLMAEIYKNGYFYTWTEREQYAFSNKVNVDINTVLSVVNECFKWGFFHQKLFDEYMVLTSKGIQKRYLMATSKRVQVAIKSELRLVPQIVSDTGNGVSDDRNEVTEGNPSTESTQSKVKESKSKVKERNKPPQDPPRDSKTYPEDSPAYKMALYLYQKIMEHAEESGVGHLIAKSNLQKWADDCRKLLELDKVDKALIRDVIDWSTSHHFWKSNILSASKLRNKFKDLAIQMAQEKKPIPPVHKNAKSDRTPSGKPKIAIISDVPQGPPPTDEEIQIMLARARKLDSQSNRRDGDR
ncbi:DUF4373 domain-containing protein [Paenibacillus sp. HJGM_3]|uniref:DUF4373 domain-containing protein n=1 Tax=Paenibacillus sp. HJGM_3 TaxID=3379816 RepID=UPI00385CD070